MSYDPKTYWETERLKAPTVDKKPNIHLENFLKKHISAQSVILDYGAGVGRLFPYYIDSKSVLATDLHYRYKAQCDAMAKGHALNYLFDLSDNLYQYPDKHFDICVCSEVFLHVKPAEVETLYRFLLKKSKRLIINTYFEEGKPFDTIEYRNEDLARHVFHNNVIQLLDTSVIIERHIVKETKQLLAIVE